MRPPEGAESDGPRDGSLQHVDDRQRVAGHLRAVDRLLPEPAQVAAERLGVENGDLLTVATPAGSLTLPALVYLAVTRGTEGSVDGWAVPAATAAAEPPEDPPDVLARSQGLWVMPNGESVVPNTHSSGTRVIPTMTAPNASSSA